MSKFQITSSDKLKQMLEQCNFWLRMHTGKLLAKEQTSAPARIVTDAVSYIISYYDDHLNYVCTVHIIKTSNGKVLHEPIKDASIDGIRYKASEELRG